MEGKKLLQSIRLQNLLSYGSELVTLDLEPLNVLIGPNASGKSNFVDAISVLAAAPQNLLSPFRERGAVEDWLWKGSPQQPASIHVRLDREGDVLDYGLAFGLMNSHLQVFWESLVGSNGKSFARRTVRDITIPPSPEGMAGWAATLSEAPDDQIRRDKLDRQQSLLSQFRDPLLYPQLTFVGDQFRKIALFRGWPFGRDTALTKPQRADLPDDFLLEDGSNLALVLNDLQNRRATKRLLLEKLRLLYDGVEDLTTKVQGGTIQIFFHEEGLRWPVPAARLSDGTLHFLCLLTILLHPDPPPLICIEEPELGLHPDVLPKVADLLLDASRRTQLLVTTHSETLVSRLSEVPESVVVCERDSHGTHLRRLEPEKLRAWLNEYMLGEVWRMGEIGGNRW